MAHQCVRWSRISEVGEARFAETMLPQTTSMVRSVFFVLSWLQSEDINRYRYENGGMIDKSALLVVTHRWARRSTRTRYGGRPPSG